MAAQTPTSAGLAFREGRLSDCYELIARASHRTEADSVLAAEALTLLGRSDDALIEAKRLAGNQRLEPSLLARCTVILANERWHAGDFEAGLELYRAASNLAENSKDVSTLCRVKLQLLEKICDSTGFDSSLPLATLVRRVVTRSDDPQIHALAHLSFGRLEAKAGRLPVAQRHFQLARNLLATAPNAYLQAAIDLDESVALWLQGSIASAIEIAERGGASAAKIGWSQGRRIAYGNLACLYVCACRLADAQVQIRLASREPFLSVGAENALADTQARALLARGDYQGAEKTLSTISNEGQVQPWYRLTAELTRIELFLMTGRWSEVVSKSDSCIKQSDEARLRPLATAFRLAEIGGVDRNKSFDR